MTDIIMQCLGRLGVLPFNGDETWEKEPEKDTAGMHQEERPAIAMTPLEAAMTRDFLAGTAQSEQRCAKEGREG
ncbi:hypothetical protein HYFRA_00009147 [Hymenoscyphus fraxineus]|uniref:Uncharacterized protein n=1 Tax=Hymenoscyphus fraxineus TaxID=746836 RepID=A0A9N9KXZ9_9HELO|nr:hypothetical protein HYFRA_00009147 [Hymenoscyphus fraxineus]